MDDETYEMADLPAPITKSPALSISPPPPIANNNINDINNIGDQSLPPPITNNNNMVPIRTTSIVLNPFSVGRTLESQVPEQPQPPQFTTNPAETPTVPPLLSPQHHVRKTFLCLEVKSTLYLLFFGVIVIEIIGIVIIKSGYNALFILGSCLAILGNLLGALVTHQGSYFKAGIIAYLVSHLLYYVFVYIYIAIIKEDQIRADGLSLDLSVFQKGLFISCSILVVVNASLLGKLFNYI